MFEVQLGLRLRTTSNPPLTVVLFFGGRSSRVSIKGVMPKVTDPPALNSVIFRTIIDTLENGEGEMHVRVGSTVPVGRLEARPIANRFREAKNEAYRVAFRMKLVLVSGMILVAALLGCAHNPPPASPPPPPSPPPATVIEKPKAILRHGDWIIRNCAQSSDGKTCYCHAPAERIDATGQQQHTVIECR